ncbi:MAG: MaoC family dehydratase N-terminal domain-containing protein [Gemmobacter sp.]|jgi:hypothetical protein|nr:MaoC family dehydratase N-terminal domain-containing protein [Gemmobacter sp.]
MPETHPETLLTDEIRAHIGMEGPVLTATEQVERGYVRRFAQAIMDVSPEYAQAGNRDPDPLSPPLLPLFLFQRPFPSGDYLTERAGDPDFDGTDLSSYTGLPELPLPGLALLNGGAEVEFFRYARHGELVEQQSRYLDIRERQSSKGPMLLVLTETTYSTVAGEKLLRVVQTDIRR